MRPQRQPIPHEMVIGQTSAWIALHQELIRYAEAPRAGSGAARERI